MSDVFVVFTNVVDVKDVVPVVAFIPFEVIARVVAWVDVWTVLVVSEAKVTSFICVLFTLGVVTVVGCSWTRLVTVKTPLGLKSFSMSVTLRVIWPSIQ